MCHDSFQEWATGQRHDNQVDSVHVMEKVVVSGSRDRGISVWSIEQVDIIIIYHHLCTKTTTSIFVIAIISSQVVAGGEANSKPCSRNPDMHKGWVRLKSYGSL